MAESTLKKWSDEEKTKFLVQAIKQMQRGGARINFKDLNIPGRTPKALTHLWDKLSKEVAPAQQDGDAAADGASEPATPASKASTPASKRAGGKCASGNLRRNRDVAGFDEDDDADKMPATPTKRQRKAPVSRARAKPAQSARAFRAVADDDESEMVKPDPGIEGDGPVEGGPDT